MGAGLGNTRRIRGRPSPALKPSLRQRAGDSRGAPGRSARCRSILHRALGVCASAAHVGSGLFYRNTMSRAGGRRKSRSLQFAVLSRGHQEVHRPRPVTACQGIPLTKGYNYVTAEGRDQACRFLASLGFPWIFRDSRCDSASTTEQGSCYCCRCTS